MKGKVIDDLKQRLVELKDIQSPDNFGDDEDNSNETPVNEMPEQLKMYVPQMFDAPAGKIFKTNIRKVVVEGINFDEECREDFIRGKGIIISNPESFNKSMKNYDGLQSPFFGTDYGDDAAFNDRWTCECGKYTGKMFDHIICDECNTEVQYCEADLKKFGWIKLDKYMVMQPLYYQKLENALGNMDSGTDNSVLKGILNVEYCNEGQIADVNDEKTHALLEKHPFLRRGMVWLSQNMITVLDYYAKKRGPKKKPMFDELYENIDKIFCHCLPVYSSVLRIETPGNTGEKFFKVRVNSLWGSIIKTVNKINDYYAEEPTFNDLIEINKFLRTTQNELQAIYDEEFSIISGKKGIIQAKVISGRVNYSARTIIKAGSGTLHGDEVEMPYIVFLNFFERELMNLYTKLMQCSIKQAQIKYNEAKIHFDNDFYLLMLYMISDRKHLPYIHIVINRNPSINFGSFCSVKIASISSDISDRTLTVNTRIIKTMGADFDGDQLNIFRIEGGELGSKFELNMSPKYNLYISKTNGRVNPSMMPTKNETVGFFQFNNIGETCLSISDIIKLQKKNKNTVIKSVDDIPKPETPLEVLSHPRVESDTE